MVPYVFLKKIALELIATQNNNILEKKKNLKYVVWHTLPGGVCTLK